MPSNKPLHSYEQSMLLVAMLFDRKSLPEILKLLPDEQSQRMLLAQDKFAKLERNERMTQIILELRRLLLIDEHRIDWIHQSWIDDALAKEPSYLKPIIIESIAQRSKGNHVLKSDARVPLPLIFSTFVDQLTKTPQKMAIFDPVLIKLQSARDDEQEEILKTIGLWALSALEQSLDKRRFIRYLTTKGFLVPPLLTEPIEANPFMSTESRRHYLKELLKSEKIFGADSTIYAGLIACALYLSAHKFQWQRVIVLGLKQPLGLVVQRVIKSSMGIIDKPSHALLSSLLLASFHSTAR